MPRGLPLNLIAVAGGAALGAVLRYAVSLWAVARWGQGFPYGTLIINVTGSLLIGAVLGYAGRAPISEALRLLIVTGLLGGFTTFSTFSYEAYALALAGRWPAAAAYVVASLALGLVATAAGAAAQALA